MDALFIELVKGVPNFAGFVLLAYILNRFLFAMLDMLKIVIMALLADDKTAAMEYIKEKKVNGQSLDL
jgi:hypothetical protein